MHAHLVCSGRGSSPECTPLEDFYCLRLTKDIFSRKKFHLNAFYIAWIIYLVPLISSISAYITDLSMNTSAGNETKRDEH